MKFLKCDICGNVLALTVSGGVKPVCCGKNLRELRANIKDASKEKHLPVCEIEDDIVRVRVGSIAHSMTEEHLINWIMVEQSGKTQFYMLEDGASSAEAKFKIEPGVPFDVYCYCNLHDLWKTSHN
jgi:superoxide reductase